MVFNTFNVMSLKNKAISSFNWTILDGLVSQGFLFIVGIVLARILSPEEIGIIGYLTVFLAIANIIVEAGFGSALIRKTTVNVKDYNTVFFINLITAFGLYILLYLTAEIIASFFETPILKEILQLAGAVLIINALSLIHKTQYTKFLKFKLQAIVSVTAAAISGICALIMAYAGYGVWSLVALAVVRPAIVCIVYWITNDWRPKWLFSYNSFKELFDFGYKLLLANMINTIYHNIFYIVIGKYFSTASLGFYTRAEQFKTPVSSNITAAIQRISFPILSTIKDDEERLKIAFQKFIRFAVYINFPILLGLIAMAKPMVFLLIGEKWETSILYFQLLCIAGLLYPLQILHLNLLLVKGHSNLNLRLEVIKKLILVPIIILSIKLGILFMIYGLVFFAFIEFFINSFYTRKLIGYSWKEQFMDILPILFLSLVTSLIMFSILYFKLSDLITFILQIIIGIFVFILGSRLLNLPEFDEVYQKVQGVFSKLV